MASGAYSSYSSASSLSAPSRARATQRRLGQGMGKFSFLFTTLGSYFFLWAPILLLIVFSFNDSRSINTWVGFTTRWYVGIFSGALGDSESFSSQLMLTALGNSLFVAGIATLLSTLIGTLLALALARGKFRGKRAMDGLLMIPMIIPDITQAFSLAMFFKVVFDFIESSGAPRPTTGFATIIIGHVAFNLVYVAIVVRARLADMNPRLEEAARDLGADGWRIFWRVTFPLIVPAIVAGALLAFTMSLDDFILSFYLSGVGTTTLPIYVYGLLKVSITPEINAISTLMLVASTVLIGISLLIQGKQSRGFI